MKVKGIGIIEQHIEKVVLIVFIAVFLGVFAAQFLREPNQVQIDKDKVAPSKIANKIELEAKGVMARLDDPTTVAVDLPPEPSAQTFLAPLREASPTKAPLAYLGNLGQGAAVTPIDAQPIDNTNTTLADNPYHVPSVPSVSDTVAVLYGGTIDPLVLAAHPELSSYVPAQQPYDAFWVTVQGSFDVASFRKDLMAFPDNEAQLPRNFTDTVEVLAVDIVRERLDSSGGWVEQQVIGELPGNVSLRDRLDDPNLKPQELLTDLLATARDQRQALRRPAFYPVISGDAWTWPSQILASGFSEEVTRQRDLLVRQRRGVAADIARIEKLLNPAKNATPGSTTPSGSDRGPRGDVGPTVPSAPTKAPFGKKGTAAPGAQVIPTGGGGGARKPSRDRSRTSEDNKQSKERLEARLNTAREELARLDQELADLGFDPAGLPLQGAQGQFEEDNLALNDETASTITLWGHDITAQPGETYRYALRVQVTNPLFGKADQVPAAQAAQTTAPVLTSEPTNWSPPINVPRQSMYFVTSGSDGGGLASIGDRTTATIEVFRFYYGYWRMAELSLAPGEPVEARLELPDTLRTFTLETDTAKEMTVVTGQEPSPRALDFQSDTQLLDVAVAEAGGGERWVNVFLATDGEVVVRDPATDEDSDDRLQYAESARHGAVGTLGEPKYQPGGASVGSSSRSGQRDRQPPNRDERRRDERPTGPTPTGGE
ncbi:MAG: hypothetical protein KDA20_09190 [Phycisphaerales bacterium]|nr:hypothetical protein [Phycisphaerales bacterium]